MSATQDTVWYEVERQQSAKYYGLGGSVPPGMGCMGPNKIDPIVTDTITEMYTLNRNSKENLTTQAMYTYTPPMVEINAGIYKTNIHNRYATWLEGEALKYDSCAEALAVMPDAYVEWAYLEGVGLYQMNSANYFNYSEYHLEFYRKGSESYGTYTPLNRIMNRKTNIFTDAPKAFPNPFTENLTLQFNSAKTIQDLEIKIYNQLGQQVYAQPFQIATGKQEIELSLQQIPDGIYLIQFSNKELSESIRVIKH